MKNYYKHPLEQAADVFLSALAAENFNVLDTGTAPELVSEEQNIPAASFLRAAQPLCVSGGKYLLRTQLLPALLPGIAGPLPIRAAACGLIYDGTNELYPEQLALEGVIAQEKMTVKDLRCLLGRIVRRGFGIGSDVQLESSEPGTFFIQVLEDGKDPWRIGQVGSASWAARALLGLDGNNAPIYIIRIDLDAVAQNWNSLPAREELYSTTVPALRKVPCACPSFGESSFARARDILRQLGYLEFFGDRLYTSDAYVRMHMFQEAWDRNNNPLTLDCPLPYENPLTECQERGGLPTVLVPALQQALSDNWAGGETSAHIFEVGHIFLPGQNGAAPVEKTALVIGAYGEDVTLQSFTKDMDRFLTAYGISNHFFIPNDIAIAYRPGTCRLLLDEKMHYLGGNFGGIAQEALDNFKIGTEAFMCQFEFAPLDAKAAEEWDFVPPEYRN